MGERRGVRIEERAARLEARDVRLRNAPLFGDVPQATLPKPLIFLGFGLELGP